MHELKLYFRVCFDYCIDKTHYLTLFGHAEHQKGTHQSSWNTDYWISFYSLKDSVSGNKLWVSRTSRCLEKFHGIKWFKIWYFEIASHLQTLYQRQYTAILDRVGRSKQRFHPALTLQLKTYMIEYWLYYTIILYKLY